MENTAGRKSWARRAAGLALLLSLGAVLAALAAAIGSAQELWHFRAGFTVLRYALFAAIAGALVALVAIFLARRARTGVGMALIALAVSLAFLFYLGNQIRTARSVPAIHDVTTNVDDPPQFSTLSVRPDNLDEIPDNGDAALKALPPEARWKALHRQAYGDLRTVVVPWPVTETIERTRRLAERRGWAVAKADPQGGTLEATDTTLFFRFKDDVVVRARPAPGGGSAVDMRSISRVGVSDVGVNAERIRSFLEDLQQGS